MPPPLSIHLARVSPCPALPCPPPPSALRFAALTRAAGWMGIAFSRSECNNNNNNNKWQTNGSDMCHTDMIIGRMRRGGPEVRDYFSIELGAPTLDTDLGCEDDVADASLEAFSDGTRLMRFSRAFATADAGAARGRLRTGTDVVKKAQVPLERRVTPPAAPAAASAGNAAMAGRRGAGCAWAG